MSWGIRCRNSTNNHVTIDENLRAYVYLGKYAINSFAGPEQTIDVTCAGFPIVFFGLPYNVSDAGAETSGVNSFYERYGINVSRTLPLGGNQWRITVMLNNPGNRDLGLYLRVFGRLDLNHLSGSGEQWGVRIRNPAGELVFDSGYRMLKLAGNSYDTELVLPWQVPDQYDSNAIQDRSTTIPFDMANKSICANARGIIHWPYNVGGYTEWDGQPIEHTIYDVVAFTSMYWAAGSQLQVRRIAVGYERLDVAGGLSYIDTSGCQTVYSRLAVIDNSQFP